MPTMNSRTRRRLLPVLFARDGRCCKWCGEELTEKTARIDHVNNDNSDNALTNMQILCHSCNVRKDPRGLGRFNPKRGQGIEHIGDGKQRTSAELERNKETEPRYRRWLLMMVQKHKFVNGEDAVFGGAEAAHCSPETAKKYLRKLTSIVGMFDWDDEMEIVQLKREYETQVFRK